MQLWLNEFIQKIQGAIGPDVVVYAMVFFMLTALVGHLFIYYVYRAQKFFLEAFNKRVIRHLNGEYENTMNKNVSEVIGSIINKCHYDVYHLRRKYQRRRFDTIKTFLDSLFMIDVAAEILVHDCKEQISYLSNNGPGSWKDLISYLFNRNPVYNKFIGVFSFSFMNKFFEFYPALFLISGFIGGMWEYHLNGVQSDMMLYPLTGSLFFIVMNIVNIVFNSIQNRDSFFIELGWNFELLWINRVDDEIINLELQKMSPKSVEKSGHSFQKESINEESAIDIIFQRNNNLLAAAMEETFSNNTVEVTTESFPPPLPFPKAA